MNQVGLVTGKEDIITRLRKEILLHNNAVLDKARLDAGLGNIIHHFPGSTFPVGAIHEFISRKPVDAVAGCGFVAGIISYLQRTNGVIIWIGPSLKIFPPALHSFNIDPSRILFVDGRNEKESLWLMEESLKCEGLAAVVGEIPEIDFTVSRRLQLAVEKSRVTGFLLRHDPKRLATTACFARWEVQTFPGHIQGSMPGVGSPTWSVHLVKVRNGKPGQWVFGWGPDGFRYFPENIGQGVEWQKKTG